MNVSPDTDAKSTSIINTIEFRTVFIVSFVVFLLLYVGSTEDRDAFSPVFKSVSGHLTLLISVSVTLAGFFLTTLSIVLVFPETRGIQQIKKSGNFHLIPKLMISTVLMMFFLFLFGLVGVFLNLSGDIFVSVLIFLIVSSFGFGIVSIIVLARLTGLANK